MNRPSLLWVGKAPVNDGGDEIYDRKLLAVLEKHFAITRFPVSVQSRGNQVRAILSGLPHPRFKYAGADLALAFQRAAAEHDHLVISLDSLENLARLTDRPVTLIIHNVTHNVLVQLYGGNLVGRLAAAQSRRWEQRLYRQDHIRLITLSQRDQALIGELAPGRDILISAPGLPPLAPLQGTAVLRELVLSGSYDWRPKRRDLIALANDIAACGRDFAWRHDLPLPDTAAVAPIARAARPIALADYRQGIRFGVIPDRFLGGFKLKSTYFIANNCVLLSRCDIRSEFDGLPFADQFVHYTPTIAAMVAVMDETLACDPAAQCLRWQAFQQACAERFSWDRAAAAVMASLTGNA